MLIANLAFVCICALQIGILFGDVQYFVRFHQFGGWHTDARLLAHIPQKCVSVSGVHELETVCLVVHLSQFAAVQVPDTDTVRTKVSLGTELFPMALVWFIGLEFGIYQFTICFRRSIRNTLQYYSSCLPLENPKVLIIEKFRQFFPAANSAVFLSSNLSHASKQHRMCWIRFKVNHPLAFPFHSKMIFIVSAIKFQMYFNQGNKRFATF